MSTLDVFSLIAFVVCGIIAHMAIARAIISDANAREARQSRFVAEVTRDILNIHENETDMRRLQGEHIAEIRQILRTAQARALYQQQAQSTGTYSASSAD